MRWLDILYVNSHQAQGRTESLDNLLYSCCQPPTRTATYNYSIAAQTVPVNPDYYEEMNILVPRYTANDRLPRGRLVPRSPTYAIPPAVATPVLSVPTSPMLQLSPASSRTPRSITINDARGLRSPVCSPTSLVYDDRYGTAGQAGHQPAASLLHSPTSPPVLLSPVSPRTPRRVTLSDAYGVRSLWATPQSPVQTVRYGSVHRPRHRPCETSAVVRMTNNHSLRRNSRANARYIQTRRHSTAGPISSISYRHP